VVRSIGCSVLHELGSNLLGSNSQRKMLENRKSRAIMFEELFYTSYHSEDGLFLKVENSFILINIFVCFNVLFFSYYARGGANS